MSQVRTPAVAGTFYPANPKDLQMSVDNLLASAITQIPCPKAIIAPHAGYVYSGAVAASVYARLTNSQTPIKKVILLGPSHNVAFRGIAATSCKYFRTPLGDIPIDTEQIQNIIDPPYVDYLEEAHLREHCLEVHLPFLQRTLGPFTLVPLVVGDCSPERVNAVLEPLWGGNETLIVVSTDLSHFHEYKEARRLDQQTSGKIQQLSTGLTGEDACGYHPVNGLMYLAKLKGYKVEQVDLRNSGDTSGDTDRVVGYGSYALAKQTTKVYRNKEYTDQAENPDSHSLGATKGATKGASKGASKGATVNADMIVANNNDSLSLSHRQILIQTARKAISDLLDIENDCRISAPGIPASLHEEKASFVTLNLNNRLRGCIGSLVAHRALIVDVAENAQAAANRDPRFKPVTLEEYHRLEIHLSVLSTPAEISFSHWEQLLETIRPRVDGLVIEEKGQRATYLPSVWEQLPDPETFVMELRRKAGLHPEKWSTSARVFRYTTEEFS